MPDLPKKEAFKPEDIDEVIRHYRKPLGAERKQALMNKLKAERERFIAREQSQDQKQNRGRSR